MFCRGISEDLLFRCIFGEFCEVTKVLLCSSCSATNQILCVSYFGVIFIKNHNNIRFYVFLYSLNSHIRATKGGKKNRIGTRSCDVNTAFEVNSLETWAGFGSLSSCFITTPVPLLYSGHLRCKSHEAMFNPSRHRKKKKTAEDERVG